MLNILAPKRQKLIVSLSTDSAAGGSDDWAKAVAGVPLSYTIELPGGGSDGFNPPATSIVKTGRETLVGVLEFAKEVKKMK